MDKKVGQLKIVYKQLKALSGQVNESSLPQSVVINYHKLLDNVSELTDTDFSDFKLQPRDQYPRGNYNSSPLKANLAMATARLGGMLNIEDDPQNVPQQIVQVLNQNTNTLAITIEQTIHQIITNEQNNEVREKLQEIDDALVEKDKHKVSKVMKWLIDSGLVELLWKILPEILKRLPN